MKQQSKKKIFVICENEFINDFFNEALEEIEHNIKYFYSSDTKIVDELIKFKPALIVIYFNSFDDTILKKIKENTLLAPIPILFYGFKEESPELEDSKCAFVKLPINNEQLLMEIDKILFDKKYIMIVDDSKIIHKQLIEILSAENFGILQAYDGKEAFEILKLKKLDILLTDIEMPNMNGYELCRAVKQNPATENLPIVILSSLTSGVDIDRGFDVGANDYLTKPINAEELITRLNAILMENVKHTREKVLVVDDSKMIRNMIVQGLEQQGFKVFSAVNGKDGYEKALQCEPDIITTDYDMPIMNGWELCQLLRKDAKIKDIPVIMLTSRDATRDRAKQSAAGVKAYLTKPFSVDKLLVIVERLIAEKKMQREREILKNYVSDAAYAEAIKRGGTKTGKSEMRAKEIFATVMFTDIAQFTPTCEKLKPHELVDLLNEYFDVMCRVVIKYGGNIDKFIGDAIMAVFAKEVEIGAANAVKAGIEMIQELKKFNEGRDTPIHMRVGINSGNLYIGDIGSKLSRRDFTVIGDSVNVAQRLESNCPIDGVLISESTYKIVKDFVNTEKIGPLKLKGKSENVYAYSVLGVKSAS